jgi:hypothetical protein
VLVRVLESVQGMDGNWKGEFDHRYQIRLDLCWVNQFELGWLTAK